MSSKKVGVFGIFSTRIAVDNAMDSLVRASFATSDISVLLPESLGGSKNMGTEKETKAPEGTIGIDESFHLSTISCPPLRLCRTVYGLLLDPRSHCGETRHNPGLGISVEPVRSCATAAGVSWSKFNSCWGTHPYRRRNAISAANRISDIRSTTSERACIRRK